MLHGRIDVWTRCQVYCQKCRKYSPQKIIPHVLNPVWLRSSVQLLSPVQLFVTPWTAARQASLVHHQLPELAQTHVCRVGDAVQPSHLLSASSPSAFSLSQYQGLLQWVSSSYQVPKVLEFHLQYQFFQYSGLISFRIDWLDLRAVQGTLKSLLQHHSSKASILWCSAFIVQLSYPHMTTGKTIALTRWTFVGKMMSLLFNMLSRLTITFLPRSKSLLKFHGCTHHLQILEPK